MKYRTSFWLKKKDVDYVRKIYPIYGAKNLSALINGILHYFAYAENPPGVDIHRLLQDAVAGRVYVENPEIVHADQIRNDFFEMVTENYEYTMLSLLCEDENFLSRNKSLRSSLQYVMATQYEHIITDAELDVLFAQWKDAVKQNGKFREVYGQNIKDRFARAKAKYED